MSEVIRIEKNAPTRNTCVKDMKCLRYGGEVEGVWWEKFRDKMTNYANDRCGMMLVCGPKRKAGGTLC